MRVRLAATMTAAILFVPLAVASAAPLSAPLPVTKCPASSNFIFDHCDGLKQ
jgi:hypothetical protein